MALPLIPIVLKWAPLVISAAGFIRDTFFGKKEEKEEQKQQEKVVVREIVKSPPVDVRNAQLEEIQKTNAILAEYKNNAIRYANSMEDRLINLYKDYIDKLINSLDKSMDNERLKRLSNRIKNQLQGSIANEISRNLSIDNARCAEILKTPEPSYRGTLLQEFINNMNADALKKAKDILIDNLQDSANDIAVILNDKISSEEMKLKSSIDYLQDFKSSHNLEAKQQKELQICYKIYIESNAMDFLHNIEKI